MFVVKAAVFLGAALLLTEALWRGLGYLPTKSDAMHFKRLREAADGGHAVVALVGSSRVRNGLNPHELDRTVPGWRFFQLGILGNSAMPVLEDLANDPKFTGRVICELNPPHWGGGYPFGKLPEALAYSHPEISGAYLESMLDEQAREHFSFYSYNMFTELPRILQHKPIPRPDPPDRYTPIDDYGPAINAVLIRNWEVVAREAGAALARSGPSPIPGHVWIWVDRIRRRGGDVAFVRPPVDGSLRVVEEAAFPHAEDLIRDVRAHGIVVVDYAEMPDHFRCPDGSHMAARDADRFSRMLGQELAAKGFFR